MRCGGRRFARARAFRNAATGRVPVRVDGEKSFIQQMREARKQGGSAAPPGDAKSSAPAPNEKQQ